MTLNALVAIIAIVFKVIVIWAVTENYYQIHIYMFSKWTECKLFLEYRNILRTMR